MKACNLPVAYAYSKKTNELARELYHVIAYNERIVNTFKTDRKFRNVIGTIFLMRILWVTFLHTTS